MVLFFVNAIPRCAWFRERVGDKDERFSILKSNLDNKEILKKKRMPLKKELEEPYRSERKST